MIKQMFLVALLTAALGAAARGQDQPGAAAAAEPIQEQIGRLEARNRELRLRIERLEKMVDEMETSRRDAEGRLAAASALLEQVGTMLAQGKPAGDVAPALAQAAQALAPGAAGGAAAPAATVERVDRPGRPAGGVPAVSPRPTAPAVAATANVRSPVLPTSRVPRLNPRDAAGGTGGGIVAAVDIVKVFDSLVETAEAEAAFQIAREKYVDDARERGKAIVDMRYDLGILAEGTSAYEKHKENLEQELQRYQIWRSVQMNAINRRRSEQMEQIYNRAVETIGRIATENGYDVVVYKERAGDADINRYQSFNHMAMSRKLLFNAEQEDLTGMVITRMNAEFAARAAGR